MVKSKQIDRAAVKAPVSRRSLRSGSKLRDENFDMESFVTNSTRPMTNTKLTPNLQGIGDPVTVEGEIRFGPVPSKQSSGGAKKTTNRRKKTVYKQKTIQTKLSTTNTLAISNTKLNVSIVSYAYPSTQTLMSLFDQTSLFLTPSATTTTEMDTVSTGVSAYNDSNNNTSHILDIIPGDTWILYWNTVLNSMGILNIGRDSYEIDDLRYKKRLHYVCSIKGISYRKLLLQAVLWGKAVLKPPSRNVEIQTDVYQQALPEDILLIQKFMEKAVPKVVYSNKSVSQEAVTGVLVEDTTSIIKECESNPIVKIGMLRGLKRVGLYNTFRDNLLKTLKFQSHLKLHVECFNGLLNIRITDHALSSSPNVIQLNPEYMPHIRFDINYDTETVFPAYERRTVQDESLLRRSVTSYLHIPTTESNWYTIVLIHSRRLKCVLILLHGKLYLDSFYAIDSLQDTVLLRKALMTKRVVYCSNPEVDPKLLGRYLRDESRRMKKVVFGDFLPKDIVDVYCYISEGFKFSNQELCVREPHISLKLPMLDSDRILKQRVLELGLLEMSTDLGEKILKHVRTIPLLPNTIALPQYRSYSSYLLQTFECLEEMLTDLIYYEPLLTLAYILAVTKPLVLDKMTLGFYQQNPVHPCVDEYCIRNRVLSQQVGNDAEGFMQYIEPLFYNEMTPVSLRKMGKIKYPDQIQLRSKNFCLYVGYNHQSVDVDIRVKPVPKAICDFELFDHTGECRCNSCSIGKRSLDMDISKINVLPEDDYIRLALNVHIRPGTDILTNYLSAHIYKRTNNYMIHQLLLDIMPVKDVEVTYCLIAALFEYTKGNALKYKANSFILSDIREYILIASRYKFILAKPKKLKPADEEFTSDQMIPVNQLLLHNSYYYNHASSECKSVIARYFTTKLYLLYGCIQYPDSYTERRVRKKNNIEEYYNNGTIYVPEFERLAWKLKTLKFRNSSKNISQLDAVISDIKFIKDKLGCYDFPFISIEEMNFYIDEFENYSLIENIYYRKASTMKLRPKHGLWHAILLNEVHDITYNRTLQTNNYFACRKAFATMPTTKIRPLYHFLVDDAISLTQHQDIINRCKNELSSFKRPHYAHTIDCKTIYSFNNLRVDYKRPVYYSELSSSERVDILAEINSRESTRIFANWELNRRCELSALCQFVSTKNKLRANYIHIAETKIIKNNELNAFKYVSNYSILRRIDTDLFNTMYEKRLEIDWDNAVDYIQPGLFNEKVLTEKRQVINAYLKLRHIVRDQVKTTSSHQRELDITNLLALKGYDLKYMTNQISNLTVTTPELFYIMSHYGMSAMPLGKNNRTKLLLEAIEHSNKVFVSSLATRFIQAKRDARRIASNCYARPYHVGHELKERSLTRWEQSTIERGPQDIPRHLEVEQDFQDLISNLNL